VFILAFQKRPVDSDVLPLSMNSSASTKPRLHKEILVALLVGGVFGPLIGWLAGMLATFFASAVVNETRGMRTSAFVGGLMGIPLGLLIGLVVSVPLRIASVRFFPPLKNAWFAAPLGGAIGWCCGFVVLLCWNSELATIVYVGLHSMFVGGMVAIVTILAKPKWL
jgi:uncharacterized protein YacL